jgi:vancomycin resistance protein YoaR
VEATALRNGLAAAVSRPDPADTRITIGTRSVSPTISTNDARVAAITAGLMSGTPLQLETDDDATFTLEPATIAGLIAFAPADGRAIAPVLDREALTAWLAELAPDVEREPTNASFTWDANGVSGVVPAVEGRALDANASVGAVIDVLRSRGAGATAPIAALAMSLTPPALSTAAAETAAGQMQRISTWTTYYVPGEGNYWNANIHIPAWDLDGHVVAPGEWFSFWGDIGPVTTERGYGYGGVILGGRSVANGALAGGICSTSTTLFNTAMRAGLEIGARMNHSYYIERYPVGLDATVLKTDTWAQDMTFRNDTPDPVVIRSYTGNGWVRFDLWGVQTGRTVSLSTPIITNRGTARETTVSNPNLAPGTSRRVEYPHNGFNAQVTRVVRDTDGNVLWENTWISYYRTVNGITEVGPAAPPPPPSEEPEPSDPPDDE